MRETIKKQFTKISYNKAHDYLQLLQNYQKKIVKASYKVAKFLTKNEIPFIIENFFKEFMLAVMKNFCLTLQ